MSYHLPKLDLFPHPSEKIDFDLLNQVARNHTQGTTPDANFVKGPPVMQVIPLIVDPTKLWVKYVCPDCHRTHYTVVKADDWQKATSAIKRTCPHHEGWEFMIRIKDSNESAIASCPIGVIDLPKLPAANCPDCKGAGEYVGFNTIEHCQRCK